MKYEIKDDNCSVVICHLKQGEKMISGNDAIAWNDACIKTKTYDPSSIFTSLFNKKNADRKISAALQDGNIAFTVGFPGNILPVSVVSGQTFIIPRSVFVASEDSIMLSSLQNNLINSISLPDLNRISGQGMCFIKIHGQTVEYDLLPGQQLLINSTDLLMMETTCKMKIRSMLKLKNKSILDQTNKNILITGPGRVIIQAIPFSVNNTLLSLLRRNAS